MTDVPYLASCQGHRNTKGWEVNKANGWHSASLALLEGLVLFGTAAEVGEGVQKQQLRPPHPCSFTDLVFQQKLECREWRFKRLEAYSASNSDPHSPPAENLLDLAFVSSCPVK